MRKNASTDATAMNAATGQRLRHDAPPFGLPSLEDIGEPPWNEDDGH
jgi:hypothetical protein